MTDRSPRLGGAVADLLHGGVFEASRVVLIHGRGEAELPSALARWGDRAFKVDLDRGFGRATPEGAGFRIAAIP